MTRRILGALCAATLLASVAASSVLAGEITGNGRQLPVNGHSACANSGQEDLQWFTTDADLVRHPLTRGVPGHAQSWGQIDKATRAYLTSIGSNPGIACNPTKATPE
jgi:hypothetical protein